MNEVANFLELIDPWWFLFFAIVILLLDWILIGSEVFLIIAFACFLFAGAKFLNLNGVILAWLIPVFLAISFFFQRQIFRPFLTAKLPIEKRNIVGRKGLIEELKTINESQDVFYKYETSIESRRTEGSINSFRLIENDGTSHVIKNSKGLVDGQTAKIIKDDSGVVTVEIIK